jgi:phosphohistidine phosphatase
LGQYLNNIILVRHGKAKIVNGSLERSLTEEGIEEVRSVASFVAKAGLTIDQIRHSEKKRASETAQIFGNHLTPEKGIIPVADLLPNDDIIPIAKMIDKETFPVMFVGHLPFLGRLVSYLLTGNTEKNIIRFPASGALSLIQEAGIWSIEWMITPAMLK